MKNFVILTLILLSIQILVDAKTIVTRTPLTNSCYSYYNNNYIFSDINSIEKYAFNKTFPRETPLQRLQRLESETFGTIQVGDIASRYQNVRTAILNRPKQNYKSTMLRNLSNYFGGQMTGFSPSLGNAYPIYGPIDYNSINQTPYPTIYGNTNITEYNRFPFSRGYKINNYGAGSGAGIRILD